MSAVLPSPTAAPRRAASRSKLLHPAAKPFLFALCLLPFVWLFYAAAMNHLGANPAEALIRATGDWTLRFLCIVLAVSPLRVMARQPALARFRRMLGLFAFFYAVLHFLSYAWLDMGLDAA
jgi:methionine sulfoxide reductase heme-binding subunit